MDFFREFALGFNGYVKALKFIDKHKLWKVLIIPAICSLIITAFVVWFAWKTSDNLTEYAIIKFKVGGENAYFNSFLEFVVVTFVRGLIFFIYVKLYRYLLLVILAPEFSYLTALVMSKTTEERHKFNIKGYFSDIWRSIRMASRNFALEWVITLIILLFCVIITWVLPLAPFLILLVEGYFFGYTLADYRNEYLGIPMKDSHKIIHAHRGLITGNGIFFNISLLIPILGVLFGPALAVIASGLSMNEIQQENSYYAHSVHQSV